MYISIFHKYIEVVQVKVLVKICIGEGTFCPCWCGHGRLICYYFPNLSIQDLFYGVHVWIPIEVKAV